MSTIRSDVPFVKSSSSSPNIRKPVELESPSPLVLSSPPILTSSASCLTEKVLFLAGETTDAPPRCTLIDDEEEDEEEEAIPTLSSIGNAEDEIQHEKNDSQNEGAGRFTRLSLEFPLLDSGTTLRLSDGLDALRCCRLGDASF